MMAGAAADDPVLTQASSVITIFAPGGIGEVTADVDLATAILAATDADPLGPLRDGDIVVVTSKIISKAQGRIEPASRRTELITSETSRTVARRGDTRIVRTHNGLTIAAAGIDTSNLSAESILHRGTALADRPDRPCHRCLRGQGSRRLCRCPGHVRKRAPCDSDGRR